MNKKHFYIAFIACIAILLAFACKTFIEPDIWWQITTGEWILQHHQVPKTDMLSYTYEGEPWVNIKWMAEVIMYLIAKTTSPEFIYLFLGSLFIPIIFFGYKNFLYLNKQKVSNFSFAFIYALLLFIITVSHRLNGRPEAFSYFFAAIYLFVFLYSNKNKYLLLLLIPLQIIWTNTHEAYGVGIFMIIIYTFSEILFNKENHKFLIVSVALFSIIGICLNPIGTKIFPYTINIFTQLDKNKFTSELLDFTATDYWDIFSFLNIISFSIASITIINLVKNEKWNLKNIHQKLPIYYILIHFAFFYLSLKSNRNIPFYQIVALPIYAIYISKLKSIFIHQSKPIIYSSIIGVYLLVVSNIFYKTFDKHNEFGLGVSPAQNPIGATNYLASQKASGKIFSDFLSANYPLYHLRPNFKSYIDLRDLDVFPPTFFENCMVLYQAPNTMVAPNQTIWQMADSLDHFSYILLVNNSDFIPLFQELNKSTNFELVYADANSSVYKRTEKKQLNKNLNTTFHTYSFYPNSNISQGINHILNPFYKNFEDRSYDNEALINSYQQDFQ